MNTVLYIEDNDDNVFMLKHRLETRGFKVLVERDGKQGVKSAQCNQPDVILMDLGLPVVSGWDAIAQIKSNPATQSIPIIALTAHSMEEDRKSAMKAGANAFVTKPVDIKLLLEEMDGLLRGKSRNA